MLKRWEGPCLRSMKRKSLRPDVSTAETYQLPPQCPIHGWHPRGTFGRGSQVRMSNTSIRIPPTRSELQSQRFPSATHNSCHPAGCPNHATQATVLPSAKLSHIEHLTVPGTLPNMAIPG
jgi:hypothetical protein